jgi:hypothetical protein
VAATKNRLTSFLTLRLAQGVAFGLLAVIGTVLILTATPEGLGLSDDSIAYIAGARSLLAGDGYREAWLESNQFVTHFPPAFSGTLALLGLLGLNPINGARLVNSLLFGVNAFLLGLLGWRATKSSVAGIVLAALFVVNDSLLRVHAVAMSEPLFLFFSLLAFLCFDFYFNPALTPNPSPDYGRGEKSIGWLIATGLLTSLAYLTRYSGLALVATFIVTLVLLNDTWKKRITSTLIYLAGFAPLTIAWSIRNSMVAGNATNRSLVWHPVTGETLKQGLRTFSEFLVPVEEWRSAWFKSPEIFLAVIAIILVAVLTWILVNGLRRFFKPSTPMPEVVGFTNGLYIFGYLASTLFSISLFDASTPLKVRILAPVYLPLLLLLVHAGTWVWNRRQRAGRVIVVGLATLVFSVSIVGQARTVTDLTGGGTGFASFKWYDSKVMDYLKTLQGSSIYTNEPGAVYLYTGRGCRVLPSQVDPVTGLAHPNFEAGVQALRADVLAGRAVLVLFDAGAAVNDQQDYLLLTQGLYLVFKAGGDVVYYAPPP